MESTIVRNVNMTAMLVGPNGEVADKVAAGFARARVHVVRVGHAAAACERLAVAMPQVVVVLGTLHADERDAVSDRATAVGALIMYVDPELDDETLGELVSRAAQAAIERKLLRDARDSEDGGASLGSRDEAPGAAEEVDSKW